MYGLLGRSLGHSCSPEIHRRLRGLDYRLFPMEEDALGAFLARGDFEGLNVTVPYKETVMKHLAGLTPRAEAVGAVNTLFWKDGALYGGNTDVCGFEELLKETGVALNGKKALVLGTGGASKCAQHALRKAGAEVLLCGRQGPIRYEELALDPELSLLVNATPVGMYPENGKSLVDLSLFPNLEAVADLVYNPLRTRLLLEAEERGIPAFDGLKMLVFQAEQAGALWTGEAFSRSRALACERSLRRERENLVLTGMPGSGKTTLGRRLASALGRPFVDTDEEISWRTGKTPGTWILEEGEAAFRAAEERVIAEIGKETGLVIASGGGAVLSRENRFSLRQNGRIVLLKRELSALPSEGRPLSLDLPGLWEERKAVYESFAELTVYNGEGHLEDAEKEILEAWKE